VTLGSALAVLLSCLAVLGTVCTATAVVVLTREKTRQNEKEIARETTEREKALAATEERRMAEREESEREYNLLKARIDKEMESLRRDCAKFQLDTAAVVKDLLAGVQALKIDLVRLDVRVENHIQGDKPS